MEQEIISKTVLTYNAVLPEKLLHVKISIKVIIKEVGFVS